LLPIGVNLVAILLRKLGNNQDEAVAGWCWIKMDSGKLIKHDLKFLQSFND